MFFILSKILAFLITPLIWIIVLSLWSLFQKDLKKKRRLLRIALVITIVFSNSFIFDRVAAAWEVPAVDVNSVKPCEYGIVLGGMSSYDAKLDRIQFFRGVDRLLQAVELYRRGKIKKIIFSGGSGSILHQEQKEGYYIGRYLLYMGIPQKDFLIEAESQNTHQNAVFTKKLLDEKHIGGKFILITSSVHMRRSLACFRKAGIDVVPYSTDRYSGPLKFEFDHVFIPDLSAMNDWNNLLHEVVGFVTYKIMGYS